MDSMNDFLLLVLGYLSVIAGVTILVGLQALALGLILLGLVVAGYAILR